MRRLTWARPPSSSRQAPERTRNCGGTNEPGPANHGGSHHSPLPQPDADHRRAGQQQHQVGESSQVFRVPARVHLAQAGAEQQEPRPRQQRELGAAGRRQVGGQYRRQPPGPVDRPGPRRHHDHRRGQPQRHDREHPARPGQHHQALHADQRHANQLQHIDAEQGPPLRVGRRGKLDEPRHGKVQAVAEHDQQPEAAHPLQHRD